MIQRAEISLQAIHNLGVLHSDPIPGIITWDEQNRCVLLIDFERSTLQNQRRMPLGITSFNLQRKREPVGRGPNKHLNCFEREKRRMTNGL
jgi:hypothetical protein